jgi:hypothetical protein
MKALRKWCIFLFVEWAGYRRPSSVSPEEVSERLQVDRRLEELMTLLDARSEVLRRTQERVSS